MRRIRSLLFCVLIIATLFLANRETVKAVSWSDAYKYYTQNGNKAVFESTSTTNGKIYFATSGALGTESGVRYRTIGFKFNVRDVNGKAMQTIYMAIGGSYLVKVNTKAVDGIEYNLYSVTLSKLKSLLSTKVQSSLKEGDCNITVDSCMILVVNGLAKGSMDDSGPNGGTVYTTYDGIANAANWSPATKTSLLSYYGKIVDGLYVNVTFKSSTGVDKFIQATKSYCYGTTIKITASIQTGYVFDYWKLSNSDTKKSTNPYEFIVSGNVTCTAYAKAKQTTVTFLSNFGMDDKRSATATYSFTGTNQKFILPSWETDGYHFTGWALSRTSSNAEYAPTASVSAKWVNYYYPRVGLYGVWKINSYELVFDVNNSKFGSSPKSTTAEYDDNITMPWAPISVDGRVTTDFLGWGLSATDSDPTWRAGEAVSVARLAQLKGVLRSDGAKITIYGIWKTMPTIDAVDLYYSISDIRSGIVTEREIARHAYAYDPQDGEIPYGKKTKPCFYLTNYSLDKLLKLKDGEGLPLTFMVTDSSNNSVTRDITLIAVDTEAKTGTDITGKLRFISRKYLTGEAGLPKDSIWFTNPAYYQLLIKAGLMD